MNSQQQSTTPRHEGILKRLWHLKRTKVLIVTLVLLGALIVLGWSKESAEWYATTTYPWLSSAVALIPSLLPFSLAEVMIVAGVVGLVIFIVVSIYGIVRTRDERGFRTAKLVLNLVCTASVVLLLFMLLAGINYHRKEFSELSGLNIAETGATYHADELNDLGMFLVDEMAQDREALGDDRDIYHASPETFTHYANESVSLMNELQNSYPVFQRPLYSAPKPVIASKALCYANIAGLFFPFTVESNINIEDPFFTQPFTMAHELAHQTGFMREDEANFIAFLACMESDDPLVRYSGAYQAFVRTYPILRRVDADVARELWSSLPDSVKEDNTYYSNLLKQYEGPVKEVSTKINDTYLKANSQHDGVAAYDRMVNLLLAWYAEQKKD